MAQWVNVSLHTDTFFTYPADNSTRCLSHIVHCVCLGVCAVNNVLYVVGGDDGSCNLASVEFYNPSTDKWTLLPTCMSTGRSYAGEGGRKGSDAAD